MVETEALEAGIILTDPNSPDDVRVLLSAKCPCCSKDMPIIASNRPINITWADEGFIGW